MSPDDLLLLDMLIAAEDARSFVRDVSWEDFRRDKLRQYAVRMAIQVVGEAARAVSEPTRAAHPDIPWPQVTGMRHRLVHDYRNIDMVRLWETVQVSLPELIAVLRPLFPPREEP